MAKVFKKKHLLDSYLKETDRRNHNEKDKFKSVYTDYAKLLNFNKDLTDKLKILEREAFTSQHIDA